MVHRLRRHWLVATTNIIEFCKRQIPLRYPGRSLTRRQVLSWLQTCSELEFGLSSSSLAATSFEPVEHVEIARTCSNLVELDDRPNSSSLQVYTTSFGPVCYQDSVMEFGFNPRRIYTCGALFDTNMGRGEGRPLLPFYSTFRCLAISFYGCSNGQRCEKIIVRQKIQKK